MAENARTNLMDAVRDLILERGYGGTSVDAICERAGVSKGSFFHHFRSKEDAACAALDSWMLTMRTLAQQSGFSEKAQPADRLLTYLDFAASVTELPNAPKGCLLGTLALELSETHPDVQAKASGYFEQWSSMIASMIQDALGDNDDSRSTTLANHFVASLEGALLLSKARQDRSIVRSSVLHYRSYIESLM